MIILEEIEVEVASIISKRTDVQEQGMAVERERRRRTELLQRPILGIW